MQFWHPRLEKNVEKLERMQKKATKIIQGLEKMSTSRNSEFGLFSVTETLRSRLITVNNYLHEKLRLFNIVEKGIYNKDT